MRKLSHTHKHPHFTDEKTEARRVVCALGYTASKCVLYAMTVGAP